jgi:hypothetical protein
MKIIEEIMFLFWKFVYFCFLLGVAIIPFVNLFPVIVFYDGSLKTYGYTLYAFICLVIFIIELIWLLIIG